MEMEVDQCFETKENSCDEKFTFPSSLSRFVSKSEDVRYSKIFVHEENKEWSESEIKKWLNGLAYFMLNEGPSLSDEFLSIVNPILAELLSRTANVSIPPKEKHKLTCNLLAKLVRSSKAAAKFSLEYFKDKEGIFLENQLSEPPCKKSKGHPNQLTKNELDMVTSCFSFLSSAPEFFRNRWCWSTFVIKFIQHKDPEVRWVMYQSLRYILDMDEQEVNNIVKLSISSDDHRKFTFKYLAQGIDPKLIPPLELEPISVQALEGSLSPSVANIEGILLPLFSEVESDQNKEPVVGVASTKAHLRNIALAVSSSLPVLVSGPIGCGKTTLIEHMASLTGRTVANQGLLKIQLGDQTDAKVLVGTYHSTDTPGEFIWAPGILTQAIREGKWLLLEDIDHAPMDVVTMLLPLVESSSLYVPGHGDVITASPGFQLFATQRTLDDSPTAGSNTIAMTKNLWRYIPVEPFSRTELQDIINARYPNLRMLVEKLLDVYYMLQDEQSTNRSKNIDRRLSSRDFLKWCKRISTSIRAESTSLTSVTTQLYVFQDAIDCFVGCILDEEKRLQLAELLGVKLNLLKAKAEFYCKAYKPTLNLSDENVTIGRIALTRSRALSESTNSFPYSWTRSSSVLLERLAACIQQLESVLLVGETGTGKTSTIQYLAQLLGRQLIVINLNQQSDSADLLGGYKPIDLKWKISPIRQEFETLFTRTFNLQQNAKFLSHVSTCFANRRWNDLVMLMIHSQQSALPKCTPELKPAWEQLGYHLQQLRILIRHADNALAFSFIEGSLVKAIKQGNWVLLDEINLATAETLECLSSVLENDHGSVLLFERGDREPITRHHDFRLFAAMNPATDVGKKQLPLGLRSRFTEYVVDDINTPQDLATLVGDYLRELNLSATQIQGVVNFYMEIRGEALRSLTDGTGRQPHYSLRTLCRALVIASSNPCGSVARSLYEAFCLSFLTQLDRSSHPIVEKLVVRHIIGKKNLKSILSQDLIQPPPMKGVKSWEPILVEGYWVPRGDLEPSEPKNYILTDSVHLNLKDLVRVVSLGRLPVLLQGETSVGKTSLIGYLAQLTGNKCVRVNNHEHTDLQEYIGSYTADPVTGKLVFREGVLVDAMRNGYWLILDELNLAPSEVLEALNRLLDDNRELFITETQETVRAHPKFLLFATQNPPGGMYGGRKLLSRAFRNRFVELHFDEIPTGELEYILHKRCAMPLSYCKRCVAVMTELQLRRRGSAAFAGKRGFMTLRDLFRWAERYRLANNDESRTFYDWDQHLADEGYLVLAGRVRKEEEALIICDVLAKHFKRKVNPNRLFTLNSDTSPVTRPILESLIPLPEFEHLVWTYALRRLAVLVGQAIKFCEPVLMVGDTGCGKTSICQYLAALHHCQLMTVNCHQYSEGSDFLGGLRPVRTHSDQSFDEASKDKLFEWVDGPLVSSMTEGHFFLADEISLADDSVLERLNSVLEPERSLLLSEKATSGDPEVIKATERFRFLSTMNPGGDYGKKELSPALRNRLTEIWCPLSRDRRDIVDIVDHNLKQKNMHSSEGRKMSIAECMVDFLDWFSNSDCGRKSTVSIRDIMAWVRFINTVQLDPAISYIHGACLVFLDSIGDRSLVSQAINNLITPLGCSVDVDALMGRTGSNGGASIREGFFGLEPFYIETGPKAKMPSSFTFQAPSTSSNLLRLLRGLQVNKPLLLEGSPGVGKTSLVAALAAASGHELVRINLSEQTDVSDLFGADLPVEDSDRGGHFEWRDGPLLRALKEGQWIVLDELNLASQSVLEGLNAVLDHRGELYIPELGRSFQIRPQKTKLFACQNPLKQGGARKGLPKSFLNRFTQVYVEPLSKTDLNFIARSVYPQIEASIVGKMVDFNERLIKEIMEQGSWGTRGGPWEFNLRDIFRWCEVMLKQKVPNPGQYVNLIYADRMRTVSDRDKMLLSYQQVFGPEYPLPNRDHPHVYVSEKWIQIGNAVLPRGHHERDASSGLSSSIEGHDLLVLQRDLRLIESLFYCVNSNWMTILVGPKGSGKTSLVRLAAQLTGNPLDVLNINSAMDTTELLGGFEQADPNRTIEEVAVKIDHLTRQAVRGHLPKPENHDIAMKLLEAWDRYKKVSNAKQNDVRTTVEEAQYLEERAQVLLDILELLDRSYSLAKLDGLRSKITKVINQSRLAAKSGSSSGGTFEWVDSLLVKALQEGRWLLMDNVNLCSASVLDRLNGLLEPNGTLTLSERGVIDGQIPEVQPHPEFRLFLAQDPRYGEISRAMRNRGIELFVHGSDEVEYPESDLISIMQSSGLHSGTLQRALLDFHRWLGSEPIPVPERPTLNELVQASSLISQRLSMLRSLEPLTCLKEVCKEIYVRNVRSPIIQEQAQEKLVEITQSIASQAEKPLIGPAMSGKEVEKSAVLARTRQACLLLEEANASVEDVRDAILFLFLTASREDVDWRLQLLANMLADSESSFQNQLRETLVKSIETSDLPWDARWFKNVLKHYSNSDVKHEDQSTGKCNRISLGLFWNTWNRSQSATNGNYRSVHNLVLALNSGALAEEAAPDKLLVVLPRFLNQLDQRIQALLASSHVHLTNSEWNQMIVTFIMRFHMAELDCLSVEPDQLESTLSCIGQYWEWLCKWTLPVVSQLLRKFDLASLEVPVLNSNSGKASSLVSRRLRRLLESGSEPFQDEHQAKCSRLISTILSLCIQPSLVSTQQGVQLVQSLPQLFASGDFDRLTEIEREMRKLATNSTPLDTNRLLIFALLDHLIALNNYPYTLDSHPILAASLPTGSGALLRAKTLPAIDCYLSHWEVGTRLSLMNYHSSSWQNVSPVFSLVALNYHENNAHINLGHSQEQFAQFGFMKEIFWNSTKWLQSEQYDPSKNDFRLALESLDRLTVGVNRSLKLDDDTDPESWNNFGIQPDAIKSVLMAGQLRTNTENLGSLWLLQGLARCLLLVPHDPVDPVEKRILKKRIRTSDKQRMERFVQVMRIHHQLLVGGELFAESLHPHAQYMLEKLEHLSSKSSEDSQRKPAWRPHASLFLQYVKDVRHYLNSVGSPNSVLALRNKLDSKRTCSEIESIVSEAELWLTAQRTFYQTLKEKYSDYPDLIVPFMAGMAQMVHGARLLIRSMRASAEKESLSVSFTDSSNTLADLFDRPSVVAAEKTAGLVKLAELSTSAETVQRLQYLIDDPTERGLGMKTLLLSALKDVERYCQQSRSIDVHAWSTLQYVLDTLVSAWINNCDAIKRRQLESESMYKTRTIHHEGEVSDAEADARAIGEYFPSYENDYSDQKTGTMETESTTDGEKDFDIPLSTADEEFICKLHTNLLLAWGKSWHLTQKRSTRLPDQSVLDGGFFLRYPLLKHVLKRAEPALSTQFDRRLIGAHLIYLQHSLDKCRSPTDCRSAGAKFNFYYDPCPDEAVACRPILTQLKTRVSELLAQWPGHAVLEDIIKLADRILSFSITSPLMKLVTGLEMLLTKAHEWEANAHKGVSIMESIQDISRLILKWRTLELDGWKQCLDKEEDRAASETTKYWFHLYSTLSLAAREKQPQQDISNHLNDVQTTLRKFMESSTLGQFEARLEMLRAFAYHVALTNEQPELLALIWHILMFYDQFSSLIAKRKAAMRQPVEKKVKDFIKIMRWNDINYYALKEAVKKAHVSLHKFIKEWREVLEQPVRSLLSEPPVDVERDEKSSVALQPPVSVVKEVGNLYEVDVSSPNYSVISRMPRVLAKSTKISERSIANCPLAHRIQVVDDLVGTVISTVDELQKLKVIGKGADKEKQKNEAKSISMRKRKSLFELFRTLQKMGLSYRKGAFMWNKDTRLCSLEQTLPILEVDGYLDNTPAQPAHEAIRRVWDKGPLYYTRCLARLAILEKKLEKPSSDLGPNVIERIKGYASHFMVVIQDQWKECSATLEKLISLRSLVAQLTNRSVPTSKDIPDSSAVISNLQNLRQLSADALGTLEEFTVLLKSYPTGDDLSYARMLGLQDALPVSIGRDVVTDLSSHCSAIVNKLRDLLVHMERNFNLFDLSSPPSSDWLFGADQWKCIVDGHEILREAQSSLREMIAIADQHSFSLPLVKLEQRFASCLQAFSDNNPAPNVQSLLPQDEELVNEIGETVLFAFQKIYKKYQEKVDEETKKDDQAEEDDFADLHLTEKLMVETRSDLKSNLRLEAITRSLADLLTASLSNSRKAQLLAHCAPLFEQYSSVVEYFFWIELATLRTSSKLLSVLLNVFNQLVEKGYCLPTELEDSKEGDSKGDFHDIESGGLGDGEGANDVSDQIENEDQLESAHQEGQKDENAEKDDQPQPKEEENGIEMSDDFAGELQDMENDKKEGDESGSESEEEGDEELDKQMDKVGDESDKLDEKLWGSDEEEEDQDQEQDDGPGDGKTSEQEITAKQNDEEEGDDDSADQGRDKKKEPKLPDEDNAEYDEDQVDPYQNQDQEAAAEPEPMDVPDDLNLDNAEAKDDGDEGQQDDENPFDIDEVKQDMPADDNNENKEGESDSEERAPEDETGAKDETDAASTTSEKDQENPDSMEVDQKEDDSREEGAPDQACQEEATPSATETVEPNAQPSNDTVKGAEKQAAASEQADVTPPEDNTGSNQEADDEDKQGVGTAESKQMEGHEGREQTRTNNSKLDANEKRSAKEKSGDPRKSDPNRALADALKERVLQAQITETLPENGEDGADEDESGADQSDLYRHIKTVDKATGSSLAKDAATEEQAKEQLSMHQEMDNDEKKDTETDDEMVNQLKEEEPMDSDDVEKKSAEMVNQSKKSRKKGEQDGQDGGQAEAKVEVEGDVALTATVKRGPESNFVTQHELALAQDTPVSLETIEQLRHSLQERLSTWSSQPFDTSEGQEAWRNLEMVTSDLAKDLCEQLRLILEPSLASRLKGDYRTGKRLNMRKVIPYIASHFRKDRIWLRRTKPAQRNYQIVLAVDDSSSMADNQSKELAFESVALISKALCLLEAGQLGIVSFGERVQLLHPLQEQFSDCTGPRILQQFTFEQRKTRVHELVDFVTAMMCEARSMNSSVSGSTAQLLLIVSDGRGLFNEGQDCVHQAIRRAKQAGLFMVFVIIDNVQGKDSILDIRVPVFENGKLLEIRPYLDSFPFPFYVILRNIQTLPVVLSDALRQWFELVATTSNV